MKLTIKNISLALLVVAIMLALFIPTLMLTNNSTDSVEISNDVVDVAVATADGDAVEEAQKPDATSSKAYAAAIVVGLAAAAGAMGMAYAIAKAVHSIARQPEADSKIRTSLMLGLVFIETAIIYALIVAILIIFVM